MNKPAVLFICFFVLGRTLLFPHPHIYIDTQTTFVFSEERLSGLRITFTFDEMYGTVYLAEYDENRNRVIDEHELTLMRSFAIENMQDFKRFIYVDINDRSQPVRIENLSVHAHGMRTFSYTFFVPLRSEGASETRVLLRMYDPGFYYALSPAYQDPIFIKGSPPKGLRSHLEDFSDTPGFDGFTDIPWRVSVRY